MRKNIGFRIDRFFDHSFVRSSSSLLLTHSLRIKITEKQICHSLASPWFLIYCHTICGGNRKNMSSELVAYLLQYIHISVSFHFAYFSFICLFISSFSLSLCIYNLHPLLTLPYHQNYSFWNTFHQPHAKIFNTNSLVRTERRRRKNLAWAAECIHCPAWYFVQNILKHAIIFFATNLLFSFGTYLLFFVSMCTVNRI